MTPLTSPIADYRPGGSLSPPSAFFTLPRRSPNRNASMGMWRARSGEGVSGLSTRLAVRRGFRWQQSAGDYQPPTGMQGSIVIKGTLSCALRKLDTGQLEPGWHWFPARQGRGPVELVGSKAYRPWPDVGNCRRTGVMIIWKWSKPKAPRMRGHSQDDRRVDGGTRNSSTSPWVHGDDESLQLRVGQANDVPASQRGLVVTAVASAEKKTATGLRGCSGALAGSFKHWLVKNTSRADHPPHGQTAMGGRRHQPG